MSAKTTKTIKTTKTTNNCPVCGLEQDKEASDCIRCGWDFSPLLGTPDQVAALLRERLDQARTAWRQCRYNPELIPVLERDPFETPAEFAARVAERPWYVGECELRKAEYDIATGRFPLQLTTIQDWAKPGSQHHEHMYLRQSRDEARELYAQSAVWPVYARLAVGDGQVKLQGLEILRAGETLPVFSEGLPEPVPSLGSQTTTMPSILSADSGLRKLWLRLTMLGVGLIVILFLFRSPAPMQLIADRYRDLGDGTVIDVRTGLQWMRCALGQTWDKSTCVNDAKKFTWEDGLAAAKTLNTSGGYAGHQDWRVPKIDELKRLIYCKYFPGYEMGIIAKTKYELKRLIGGLGVWLEDEEYCQDDGLDYARPTIERTAFPNSPSSSFWSSSPYADGADGAWGVYFGGGGVDGNYKGYQRYVRLVRGGQ